MTKEEYRKKQLSKLLRNFIDERFASYKDFSLCMGITQACASNWICGRRSVPGWVIVKLGEMFPDEISILKKIKPELF